MIHFKLLRENMKMAFETIRTHKVRSFLTVLGVVIGVIVAIVVSSALLGFEDNVQQSLNDFGINNLFVFKFDPGIHFGRLSAEERARKSLTWEDGMAIRELSRRLRKLNPSAWQLETAPSVTIDPDQLLTRDVYGLEGKAEEVRSWLTIEKKEADAATPHLHHLDVSRHDASIHAFCLRFKRPLDWSAFGIWLAMLLHCHGSDILRVKGLLNIGANSGPVVINGVQHLVHPPDHFTDSGWCLRFARPVTASTVATTLPGRKW